MSERYDEAIEELRFLAREIRSRASDVSYGYFHGGDPRNFSPDPECSTEAEREAHRVACDEWEKGNRKPLPDPHESFTSEDGKVVGYVTRSGFGPGTNAYEDGELLDWADRIDGAIERIVDGGE